MIDTQKLYNMFKVKFFLWIAVYTHCLNLYQCHDASNNPTDMTNYAVKEADLVELRSISDQANFCAKFNGKCQLCVERVQCFYCTESEQCVHGSTVLLTNSSVNDSKHGPHPNCKPTGTCDNVSALAMAMAGMSFSISIYVALYVVCWVRRPKNYFVTMAARDITGPPAYTP